MRMRKTRHRVPLTKKHKAAGGVFKGTPLKPSAAVEVRYRATLERIIARMTEETERGVAGLWKTHAPVTMDASLTSQARILLNALQGKFFKAFDVLAPEVTGSFLRGVNDHSKSSLHASLGQLSGGLSLKTSVIDGRIKEILKASTVENVGLIKSIPRQYFQKLQGDIMRAITQGNGTQQILASVQQTGEVTKKRAGLIARDQTSKATTALNAARMDALNIKEFEWSHSAGGKEPRPLHLNVLDGKIFRLDKPPIIDDRTGERGLPGQAINCRCSMVPVLRWGEDVPTDAEPEAAPEPPPPKPRAARKPRPKLDPVAPIALTGADRRAQEVLLTLGKAHKVEFLTALDDAGTPVVAPYRGEKSAVGFSPELVRLISDPANKIAVHHNHPGSNSLSPQDLHVLSLAPGMESIWAHGHDGSIYRARRAGRAFEKKHAETMRRSFETYVRGLMVAGRPIEVDDVNNIYFHVVNLMLAKARRIQYEAELSPERAKSFARLRPYVEALLEQVK